GYWLSPFAHPIHMLRGALKELPPPRRPQTQPLAVTATLATFAAPAPAPACAPGDELQCVPPGFGQRLDGVGDASSLSRCVARLLLSARHAGQLDEAEQPADAVGWYVSGAIPQAFAGPPQPRPRDIDFQGDDGFDACPMSPGHVHRGPARFPFRGEPDSFQ